MSKFLTILTARLDVDDLAALHASVVPDEATVPGTRVLATSGTSALSLLAWPDDRYLPDLEALVATRSDVDLVALPIHQLGVRPHNVDEHDDPIVAVVITAASPAEQLAHYDETITEADKHTDEGPFFHVCAPDHAHLYFVDVWPSERAQMEYLDSPLGREVVSALGQNAKMLAYALQELVVEEGQPRLTPSMAFHHRHRHFVNYGGQRYTAVYHPRSGGFVVNVYDQRGRAIGGSNIGEAGDMVSSPAHAQAFVWALVRNERTVRAQ